MGKKSRAKAVPQPVQAMDAAPVEQSRAAAIHARTDSLVNFTTGLGLVGSDRRMGARYDQRTPLVLTDQYWLWKQTWLAARICEAVPQHCARAWFTVSIPDNPEASAKLQKAVDKYRLHFRWAATLANMTGGAILALGVDDGLPPDMPINYRVVRKLIWAKAFDRWFSYPSARVTDPMSERFGEPAQYSVFGQAIGDADPSTMKASGMFDASRVIRFDGNPLPDLLKQANQGWNDSVLERVYDALRDFNQGTDAGAKTLTDFTLTVLKIIGYSQDVLAPGGASALTERMSIASQTMNTAGILAVDDSESVDRLGHKLAGFREVLDALGDQVAGAATIPKSILYGQAQGTSRAGADSDIRSFYDCCMDTLGTDWEPKLRHICGILLATPDFRALNMDADDVDIDAGSLWQEEPKTTAEIMKLEADALTALAGTGTLSPDQIHRAAVDVLEGLGCEVDDDMLTAMGATPEVEKGEGSETTNDETSPGAQLTGGMPPLAGRNGMGMPIIPDANSQAAGGA